MSNLYLFALVSALLCVGVSSKAESSPNFTVPAEPEWLVREPDQEPIIEVDVSDPETGKNIHVKAFYDDRRVTNARVEFERRSFEGVVDLIEFLSTELLQKGKSVITFGLRRGPQMFSLMKEMSKSYHEFEKVDPSAHITNEFASSMGQLIRSVAASRSTEPKSGQQAHRIVMNLVAALRRIIVASPVGLCVNWTTMTLNDVPLVDYIAPVLEGFRKGGRSGIIGILDKVGKSLHRDNTN